MTEAAKPLEALIAGWRKRPNSGAWQCADELEQALAAHADDAPSGNRTFVDGKEVFLKDTVRMSVTRSAPHDSPEGEIGEMQWASDLATEIAREYCGGSEAAKDGIAAMILASVRQGQPEDAREAQDE